MGVIIGVLLSGKIDRSYHTIGAAIILILSFLSPNKDIITVIPFALAAYIDEKMPARLLLPIISVALLDAERVLVVLLWDITYHITAYIAQSIWRQPPLS